MHLPWKKLAGSMAMRLPWKRPPSPPESTSTPVLTTAFGELTLLHMVLAFAAIDVALGLLLLMRKCCKKTHGEQRSTPTSVSSLGLTMKSVPATVAFAEVFEEEERAASANMVDARREEQTEAMETKVAKDALIHAIKAGKADAVCSRWASLVAKGVERNSLDPAIAKAVDIFLQDQDL
jgi:hypothetical protein